MNLKALLPFLIIILVGTSCVTNKKFVLLQKDDLHRTDLPIDSTIRKYDPIDYDYKLQPEDIVSVRFESLTPKEYDFFNQNQTAQAGNMNLAQGNALLIGELINQQGEIPLPILGNVKISGITIYEAQAKLQNLANQYLDQAVVKVRLLNFRFTVLGEVNREGTISVTNNRATMLEAIGLAGGLTDLADRSNVKLIRQNNGISTVQYINLLDENFINSPFYYVNQNDVLIVSSLKQRPYRKYFSQNLSLFISTVSLVLVTINIINSNPN